MRHKSGWSVVLLIASLWAMSQSIYAQTDPNAGILPFSTHVSGQYDTFDPSSGNVMLTIPVISRNGKIPFAFNLIGNFHAYVSPQSWASPQDTVAGEFDTPNRQYHPGQGRWISPDPAGIAAADLGNPQSWNRYAYVMNNPLIAVDPSGLDCVTARGDAMVTINSGDCPGNDPNNEYYYDCDGCLMSATSGFIDQNGDLILRNAEGDAGQLGLYAAISGFDYTAPDWAWALDAPGGRNLGPGGVVGSVIFHSSLVEPTPVKDNSDNDPPQLLSPRDECIGRAKDAAASRLRAIDGTILSNTARNLRWTGVSTVLSEGNLPVATANTLAVSGLRETFKTRPQEKAMFNELANQIRACLATYPQ